MSDAKSNVEKYVRSAMLSLGLDVMADPSLKDTPARIAKMWVEEVFSGLFEKPPKMTMFPAPSAQMVIEAGITVRSTCEHHFQPIYGVAHVAYIPEKRIVGLSKLNRVVDYFARRPQVQEKLTNEVAEFLKESLQTEHVAVVIDAEHFCVKMRGIKHTDCMTRTSVLSGKFLQAGLARQEFFDAIPKINGSR
jgi:GTP cyclohydrolase I